MNKGESALMASRLIQMVSFILSRTFEGDEDNWPDTRERIGELLEGHGYHPAEIAVAMDVAFRIRERLKGEETSRPIHTNRLYQYLEEIRLTREARGYLLRLIHEKVITPIQYQWITDRSLLLDMPEVGLQEIQALLYELAVSEGGSGDEPGIPRVLH
jgi:uncharacterized protein Smg (DUF494 family)